MKRPEGAIVYRFVSPHDMSADIIYVNVIPEYSCVNNCRFCSRRDAVAGRQNIYETKAGTSLYLSDVPTAEEVVETVMRKAVAQKARREVAFVGLGEPLRQFDLVLDSISGLRERGYRGTIRIDTNGLVNLWVDPQFGTFEPCKRYPARELREAGLDEIRISVNAVSEQEYQRLCMPPQPDAFAELCKFLRDCLTEGIDTYASFVVGFDDGVVATAEPKEYQHFASSLGVRKSRVVLRTYVKPLGATA